MDTLKILRRAEANDTTLTAHEWSWLLEESTGWTIETARDSMDGDLCYYIRDPYGDRDGLPFYELNDAIEFTLPEVSAALEVVA